MRDCESNVVYVTEALKRYPAVFDGIAAALAEVGVERRIIKGTKNVWCRDYFPLQVKDYFVRFAYKSGLSNYDLAQYPQLVVPESCFEGIGKVVKSDIVLDGGNAQRYGDRVIMTTIVHEHNPDWGRRRLIDQLVGLLQADIVFIPPEPGDDLGHTDGIVKWIDDKTLFLNDYRVVHDPVYRDYLATVKGIFRENGIESVPFSYAYERCPKLDEAEFRKRFPDADDLNPGWGYAVNYLQVRGAILYPTFGAADVDEWTEACLWDAFPDVKLFPIDCADLSMEGGLCNCVTMNYVV